MESMKHLSKICWTIALLLSVNITFAQCNINDCSGNAVLTAGSPNFDLAGSLIIPNIEFGNISCSASSFNAGVDVYIYQILPDGTRAALCDVFGPAPDNTSGIISAFFGQIDICGQNFNIGSITASSSNGFNACNGAVYEVELALFITETNFTQGNNTVYSQLSNTQYTTLNLGTIEYNVGNMPTGANPLTTAVINEFNTGDTDSISVACFSDVELYIEGVSILADCTPFGDYSTSISSELVNSLTYSINGASPIVIQDASTGAAGGQLTGPDNNLNGSCYSGILTSSLPYVFEASNLMDACNGNTVTISLSTTDLYTNQTVSTDFTIVYESQGNCPFSISENANPIADGIYEAEDNVTSFGSVPSGGNVTFSAGNFTELQSGFEVDAGVSSFLVEINSCY